MTKETQIDERIAALERWFDVLKTYFPEVWLIELSYIYFVKNHPNEYAKLECFIKEWRDALSKVGDWRDIPPETIEHFKQRYPRIMELFSLEPSTKPMEALANG